MPSRRAVVITEIGFPGRPSIRHGAFVADAGRTAAIIGRPGRCGSL